MASGTSLGWPVRKLLNEFKRYYASYMLIRNYYSWSNGRGEIPTLSRLKLVSGLSPRQTVSLVNVLRTAALVDAGVVQGNRRQLILRPSRFLLEEVGRSCVAFLKARDLVVGTKYAPRIQESPDLLGQLICNSGDRVLESGTAIAPFPTIQAMAEFDCGYLILVAVMANHYLQQSGGALIPTSYDSLAWRFQVSRSHVGNVINYLQSNGMLYADRLPSLALVDEFENWCDAEMRHYAVIADKILL